MLLLIKWLLCSTHKIVGLVNKYEEILEVSNKIKHWRTAQSKIKEVTKIFSIFFPIFFKLKYVKSKMFQIPKRKHRNYSRLFISKLFQPFFLNNLIDFMAIYSSHTDIYIYS
jgi:hypothetical protein